MGGLTGFYAVPKRQIRGLITTSARLQHPTIEYKQKSPKYFDWRLL